MPAPDVHTRLLQPLNSTQVPYMVTGGLAAIIYEEPRLTNDVDIVVRLEPEDAERLLGAFPAPDGVFRPAPRRHRRNAADQWGGNRPSGARGVDRAPRPGDGMEDDGSKRGRVLAFRSWPRYSS
jgi:hypothetical protein